MRGRGPVPRVSLTSPSLGTGQRPGSEARGWTQQVARDRISGEREQRTSQPACAETKTKTKDKIDMSYTSALACKEKKLTNSS